MLCATMQNMPTVTILNLVRVAGMAAYLGQIGFIWVGKNPAGLYIANFGIIYEIRHGLHLQAGEQIKPLRCSRLAAQKRQAAQKPNAAAAKQQLSCLGSKRGTHQK